MMIDLAFTEYQHTRLVRDLVGSRLVTLRYLVNLPGIAGLIAPDVDAVDVYRTIERDFLPRRQMLLIGEYQHLMLVQGTAQFVSGIGIGLRAVESRNCGTKGRIVDRLDQHCR